MIIVCSSLILLSHLIFQDRNRSPHLIRKKKKKKKKKKKAENSVQGQDAADTTDNEDINNSVELMDRSTTIKRDQTQTHDKSPENVDRETLGVRRRAKMFVEGNDNVERAASPTLDRTTDATNKNQGSRYSHTDIHTKKFEEPIIGYATEPLLPLIKACAPLESIIHNISNYIQVALHETSEQPTNDLTIDESAAIRLYTMEWEEPYRSLYSMLNFTLKTGTREELRPYFKFLKLFMTALVKLPCEPPLTVWRGVTKNLSADFPPGTPVTWWSFSSCTTALTVLENNLYLGNTGERTLFSVEAINARTIQQHSYFVTEDEILLLPGTHMIVQSQFSPAPELHIIHLKQVEPEETLIEPPFEGNLIFV